MSQLEQARGETALHIGPERGEKFSKHVEITLQKGLTLLWSYNYTYQT